MDVIHDKNNNEFKIELDKSSNEKAYLTYELSGDTIDFQHTYVPSNYRGKGFAEKLVLSALDYVEKEKSIQKITPSCSYVAKFLTNAPQYARYLAK
ncbi:unnamed protein product [Adineta ricciae]|uniref:Protein NATD1 n=1 Tax=Adineta ricciae TaxID=249248 RepID=A0A814FC18_ADIRI|nr:unnamed protein product [Adineta ricciae]